MKSFVALATFSTLAAAWTYPDCERDGCYRNLIDDRFKDSAPSACLAWLAGTTTAAAAIPTQFNNCPSVKEFSSACSCVAYTATHTTGVPPVTTTTSEKPPVTTTTSEKPPVTTTTSSGKPTGTTSAKPSGSTSTVTTDCPTTLSTSTAGPTTKWTTSTICETKTHTVTQCPGTVTDCPVKHTTVITETIPITTTVCPVTETPVHNGTKTWTPPQSSPVVIPTTPIVVPTGAAGRFGVEALAAAAGVVAALL